MGQTTQPFFFPYPEGGDAADITAVAALANKVQSIVGKDSDVLTMTPTTVSPNPGKIQSGMTGSLHYRKLGCVVNIDWAVTYPVKKTVPLKAAQVWVADIPIGYRPTGDITGAGIAGTNVALRYYLQASTGHLWMMNVNSTVPIFMCATMSFLVPFS